MKAYLALEDGSVFEGESFGCEKDSEGELVFNTSMTGYVEALTDPSYAGQLLMMTYPLIGNYGVCLEDFESDGVKAAGFVVKNLCDKPSNHRSEKNVHELLLEYDVPGIKGLDTRLLTRKIRETGAMQALIAVGEQDSDALAEKAGKLKQITEIDLVPQVSVKEPKTFGEGNQHKVVVLDCGIKMSIIDNLIKRDVEAVLVPYDYGVDDIMAYKPDGVFISNGPGDPKRAVKPIETIKGLAGKVPLAGICLGHQLVCLALGGETFKLKFGHRGSNQPVKDFHSGRVFISSQNHGFGVNPESLPDELLSTQINLNDGTCEGLRHKKHPLISVQYHPEAAPGPHDTYFFFDTYTKMLDGGK